MTTAIVRVARRNLSGVGLAAALTFALIAANPVPHGEAAAVTSNGWTTNASVSVASVAPGASSSITASVLSNRRRTALVLVQVTDPQGTVVSQQSWDNQSFSTSIVKRYTAAFVAPSATGAYTVKVGVFSPGWGTLYSWNNGAASVTVGGAVTPTPTATPVATSTPAPTATAVPTASPTPAPTVSPTPAPTAVPTATPPAASTLPALPGNWPRTLQLGMADAPGGAAAMRATTGFGLRYQYLAGGANTGNGWAHWNPNGSFVTGYIEDSKAHGMMPVFTYYQIVQSAPGNGNQAANLTNTVTMTAYFNDVKLFFQRAGAFSGTPVVLHVEPDMWGFIQQAGNGNPSAVSVQVASTGLGELAGLPNNAAGLAQAFDKLRDAYAPNVLLAYHLSVWGTGNDIAYSNPPDVAVQSLGNQAANFYLALGGQFDIVFSEFSDRDAGFKQAQYGDGGASWWDAADFGRNVLFLSTFVKASQERVVMWQIPFGNTKMRAGNNTWNHYQDNRVEWLLGDTTRAHLAAYVQAGVAGFLFGRGADGATCACDANGDGVTNPAAINGNTAASVSADDDGGYFRQQAKGYYTVGAMALP